jgi:hypothetical protein
MLAMKILRDSSCFLLLLVISTHCVGQKTDEERLVNKFVGALLDETTTSESIADQFIRYRHDEKGRSFIIPYIDTIRTYLKKVEPKVQNLRIVKFNKAKDQLKDVIITEEQKEHIYAVLNNDDRLLLPLLMENNKVVSFTTLDKGKRLVFMSYGQ